MADKRQAVLHEFKAAARGLEESMNRLLQTWEKVEQTIQNSPSEIDGYPFHESLDENYHGVIAWTENVDEWVDSKL